MNTHNWCKSIFADRPKLTRSYARVQNRTSLMSSSLLRQQCPQVLFVELGRFVKRKLSSHISPISWGVASRICSKQHTAFSRGSYLAFSSCFFVSNHVVLPYSSMFTVRAWKKSRFIISDRSDFYMIDNLPITILAFVRRMLTSLSVDEILLARYANWWTNSRSLPLRVGMVPCLKHELCWGFFAFR